MFLEDPSGREVLLQMLDRAHLERIIGADKKESNVAALVAHAMTQACHAVSILRDASFEPALKVVERDPDSNVRAAARMAMETLAKRK